MPAVSTARLRGLPRTVWVLLAGLLITRAGSFAVPFLTIFLHKERGLSEAFAGLAIAVYGVGGIVASLTGGALVDRFGRKPVIVAAPALGAVTVVALAVTQRPVAVLVMSFLAGAVSEAGRPGISAMITDVTPPERRVDAFALFRHVINLGFAVGTGLGGLLITQYGFVRLFLADAVTSLVYAAIALALLPETRPARPAEVAAGAAPDGFRAVAQDPVFRRFWLANIFSALVFTQPMATLGLILTNRGLSTSVYGALISFNGLVIIATEFWLSGITRRFRVPRVLALSALFVGVGFALTGAVGASIPLLVLTVVIWTIGEMLGAPTSQTFLAAIAPPHLRGRYAGAFGLSWSLAFAIGPVLGGLALTVRGGAPLWAGALVLSLVAAALFLRLPDVPPAPPTAAAAASDVLAGVAAGAVPAPPPAPASGRLIGRFARPRS